jgi:hypothetical protein
MTKSPPFLPAALYDVLFVALLNELRVRGVFEHERLALDDHLSETRLCKRRSSTCSSAGLNVPRGGLRAVGELEHNA